MLQVNPGKSKHINSVEKYQDGLILNSERGKLRLEVRSEKILRVTYTEKETFSKTKKEGILDKTPDCKWHFFDGEDTIAIWTKEWKALVDRNTGRMQYLDSAGNVLLQEAAKEGRTIEPFMATRVVADAEVKTRTIQTADGEKQVITEATRVEDELLYHTRLSLDWQKKEALYGLGQQEEGILNLRGHMVYVHQANRKIAMPLIVSSLGYGLLFNTDSTLIFSDNEFGSYIYTEADEEMDYFFLLGDTMDGVVARYRELTGKAALLPRWAFGYIQSQERYETAEEIISTVAEYRKRGFSLDAIVLDWLSWEDGMWGQKSFDGTRFPDPAEMMDKLHDMGAHMMISIWPNMDAKCDNYKEMKEQKLLLPGSGIYNAFSEEGRRLYWKQVEEGLFRYGIDGWWCDSSEPITPEWNHMMRVEPGVMYNEYVRQGSDLMPAGEINAFALHHAKAVYEGQRGSSLPGAKEKRVVNLTRSAWTGQQRYGTILWSGDTAATWDTLRKQVAAGISMCASGMPYWTADIGAFFVKNGDQWYWKGDYPEGTANLGYKELFTRWYQWGAMLPIFRGHGTDCRRELWNFAPTDDPGYKLRTELISWESEDEEEIRPITVEQRMYESLIRANKLRYALIPYIYSQAGKTWLEDASIMRPLAFAFTADETALQITDQYMLGESLMICPVTKPMYYDEHGNALNLKKHTRLIYLPYGSNYYDFWTEEWYEGGQWIELEADIDNIPIFVKEGAILPFTDNELKTADKGRTYFKVYAGCDSTASFYWDEGDGYDYENGKYMIKKFTWNNKAKSLTDETGKEFTSTVIYS